MSTFLIVKANLYDPNEMVTDVWAAVQVTPTLLGRLNTAMDIITDAPLPIDEIVLHDVSVTYFSNFAEDILEVDSGNIVKRTGDLPEGTQIKVEGRVLKVSRGSFYFYGLFRRAYCEVDVTGLNHAWLEITLKEMGEEKEEEQSEPCDWCGSGINTLIDLDGERVCQDCLDNWH